MRRMILRMIATGSLSAFSAAALHGPGALGGGAMPVKLPRLPAAPARGPSAAPASPAAAPQPGRVLPRGSLLDLSV
ncbi:MAG: hypothetical protein M0Z28_27125 [Rhodospirillales bacterium]|nr:hypothetical protein [Rhodospirillales bacterium]